MNISSLVTDVLLENEKNNKAHESFALMYYAITKYEEDNNFKIDIENKLRDELEKYNIIKFIQVLCNYFDIPSLTTHEKIKLVSHKTYDLVYDYVIDRCISIGNNESQIHLLKTFKNEKVNAQIINDMKDFQHKFLNDIMNEKVIQAIINNPEKLERKTITKKIKISNNIAKIPSDNSKYISIDMRTANFSYIFYYVSLCVFGIENSYKEYTDLAKKYTNNKYIIQSKYMRGILFGKLMKKLGINIIYENHMSYFMEQIYNLLESNGCIIAMMNLDEIVIKQNDFTVEQIKNMLYKLDIFGDYTNVMLDRFKVEQFILTKVSKTNKSYYVKNNKNCFLTPEIGYNIFSSSSLFDKYVNYLL